VSLALHENRREPPLIRTAHPPVTLVESLGLDAVQLAQATG
jgi:hypothetical protein